MDLEDPGRPDFRLGHVVQLYPVSLERLVVLAGPDYLLVQLDLGRPVGLEHQLRPDFLSILVDLLRRLRLELQPRLGFPVIPKGQYFLVVLEHQLHQDYQ